MGIRKHSLVTLLMLLILGLVLSFIISYARAERAAINYLRALEIHDSATYQANKGNLYILTNDEIFNSHSYSGTKYPIINYKLLNSRCVAITGINSYIIEVKLSINYQSPMYCWVYVDRGVIKNAHRKDDE